MATIREISDRAGVSIATVSKVLNNKSGVKQKTADRMPFGSYKGEVIAKVPAEYLLAMYESGKCPANVQEYVEQNMAELHLRAERDGRCRNALKSMYL